ncbi:hypothetical protein K438DRAFT_1971876 [Mycena galopus ATCC 62051]|nr:hypothetical protein K438DRAFT_1971876 [Mycena galopus ATCC 62051]
MDFPCELYLGLCANTNNFAGNCYRYLHHTPCLAFPDVEEYIVLVAVVASAEVWCSMRPSARATLSCNLSSSIQCYWLFPGTLISPSRLAPSIDKTSDAVLAAAYGRRDFMYVTPSRCSLSRILLILTDRLLRSQTRYHAALTPRSPPSCPYALRRQRVFMSDMDVLLVAHACAGSEWRGQCDGDATRHGTRMLTWHAPCGGVRSHSIPYLGRSAGWKDGDAAREGQGRDGCSLRVWRRWRHRTRPPPPPANPTPIPPPPSNSKSTSSKADTSATTKSHGGGNKMSLFEKAHRYLLDDDANPNRSSEEI